MRELPVTPKLTESRSYLLVGVSRDRSLNQRDIDAGYRFEMSTDYWSDGKFNISRAYREGCSPDHEALIVSQFEVDYFSNVALIPAEEYESTTKQIMALKNAGAYIP